MDYKKDIASISFPLHFEPEEVDRDKTMSGFFLPGEFANALPIKCWFYLEEARLNRFVPIDVGGKIEREAP